MTDWAVDLECLKRIAGRLTKIRLQVERPRVIGGVYAIGAIGFGQQALALAGPSLHRAQAHKIAAPDAAAVKRQAIRVIDEALRLEGAELLHIDGSRMELEAIIPLSIEDYAGITRRSIEEGADRPAWAVDAQCAWATRTGARKFDLCLSRAARDAGGDLAIAISATLPEIGDLVARAGSADALGHVIGFAFIDFAHWHSAVILGPDGMMLNLSPLIARALSR